MLVKREAEGMLPAARIRPGSSPLEIEIMAHFHHLWEYLSMEEHIAGEVSTRANPFLYRD
jgi:ubiquitin carboxyl-terminal hydrolase 34